MVAADAPAVPKLEVVVAVVGSAAIAAAVVALMVPVVVGTTLEASPSGRRRTVETAQDRRTLRMSRSTGKLRVAYVTG